MTDPKRRAHRTRSGFGDNAPPSTMPFPKKANLTAIEILAFFPNTIYCADVIYRLISNGGTRRSIWAVVNNYRDLESEWSANCCGEAMYKTMHKAGYTDWTIKKHGLWHDSRKASWDVRSLDVGSLKTAQGMPAKNIPFRDLAADIRTIPEGDDALDLTRMVQYCVQNSEDGWRYPKDYEELLDLLGGPAKVREEHMDFERLRKWENRKPPLPSLKIILSPPQGSGLLDGWKKTRSSADGGTSGLRARSRNASPEVASLNKRRTAREGARTRPGDTTDVENLDESDPDGGYGTPYTREPAEFVAPPPLGIARAPVTSTLAQVFQAEGVIGEADLYNAYAFGGPRRTAPYRCLCQIAQPHPWDISGWAESLRWAFEQRILFMQSFPEVSGWNESPEHMACIERERTQRVWASDELLEQMLEGD